MKIKVVKTILSVLIDVISVILPFLNKAESDNRLSKKETSQDESDSSRVAE